MNTNSSRSYLPVVIILTLSAGLIVWISHNMAHNSPSGQIKEAAKDPKLARKRVLWKPSPEQQILIDEAANTPPDYLSDELVPVLAAIPEDDRELVFFDNPNRHNQWLIARSWALRQDTVHGNAKEVQPFLDILETPVPSADAPAIETSSPQDLERLIALNALTHAAEAGDPHRARFPEFERIALENLQESTFKDNAAMLLVILDEVGGLGPRGKEALDKLRAKKPYYQMLQNWIVNAHADFQSPADIQTEKRSESAPSNGQ